MNRLRLLAFALSAFGFGSSLGSGCRTGTLESISDDCGPSKKVCLQKTIHAGLVNGESDFFEFETPEARNDCEATYGFIFRWADPVKRAVDSDMPPLEDLAHAFQPGGEFAYFPHSAPIFVPQEHGDCNDQPISGAGWWTIGFQIGNKNSSLPTTRYYVRARLDPALAGSLDDTEILCTITYYDKPKQSQ